MDGEGLDGRILPRKFHYRQRLSRRHINLEYSINFKTLKRDIKAVKRFLSSAKFKTPSHLKFYGEQPFLNQIKADWNRADLSPPTRLAATSFTEPANSIKAGRRLNFKILNFTTRVCSQTDLRVCRAKTRPRRSPRPRR